MSFKFKQFAVKHSKSSMKVGTDAVLLGSWANFSNSLNLLEVGTGCGVISLIVAQREGKVNITAIDIDENSVIEAEENFKCSKWSNRLKSLNISFQNFTKTNHEFFDHIVCNPPFFANSTPSPLQSRHFARHTDKLNPQDFFENCLKTLNIIGKISIIIPSNDYNLWEKHSIENGFFTNRITTVFAYPTKVSERKLIEFSRNNLSIQYTEIYIRKGKNMGFTDQYLDLTKEFYLPQINKINQ
ncbi:MAG: methyltransferase [Bacteroidetes bacterium]|nr:methyltransferase [Bacteroidota bacterium]